MSDFLMIAPGNFFKVEDVSVLPYGAEFFEQHEGIGGNTEITEMFGVAGIISEDQAVDQVKYINETGEVWYSLQG